MTSNFAKQIAEIEVISIPNVAHNWIRLSLLLGRFDYAQRVSWTARISASTPGVAASPFSRAPGCGSASSR